MMERHTDPLGPAAPSRIERSATRSQEDLAIRGVPAGIHGRVLENLLDGVIVIERGGGISVFNAAAGRILGISPDEATGKTFGELFVMREGFEEFSELILDTVAGGGQGGRQVVALQTGDEARSLSVATSYIRSTLDRDGNAEPVALIAVFSDITEIRELRETELRMAKEVEAQHAELQTAYRQIEERNETLAAMLKKVQVARIAATVLVIGVFLGAGAYVWQPLGLLGGTWFGGSSEASVLSEADAGAAEGFHLMMVEPQPVHETISLVGKLAPWRTVTVTSPFESRVSAMYFQYGQEVREGDLLVEMDTSEVVRKHRAARVAYIEALKAFETVNDWESSSDMAAARRSFTRARMALESQETRLNRSAFLFEQGLIAASEHEETERQYQGQVLDFEAAREDLDAVRARGDQTEVDKAAVELSTAEEELREIEQNLAAARLHAPVSGVVLAAASGGSLEEGQEIASGQALLTMGDFSRMAASAMVDEVDVVRIAPGQAVSVTGNAFRDLQLNGAVTHVSSQPESRGRGTPYFKIVVTLAPLSAGARERVRTGMSTRLTVEVYSKDDALMVPLEAVEGRGDKYHVQLVDPETGAISERAVTIGPTTQDSVEIMAGLQPGDQIAIPEY